MSLTISLLGTNNSVTLSSSVGLTGVAASVGDTLVVIVGGDNSGAGGVASLTGVSDGLGNTYASQGITTADPGAANQGITLGVFVAKLTVAVGTGDTISANFSPDATSKTITVYRVVPATGYTTEIREAGPGAAFMASLTASITTTSSVAVGDTVFGAVAMEGTTFNDDDSDTTNGSWSAATSVVAATGTTLTSVTTRSQYKTTSGAAGTQTYDVAHVATRDWAINYVTLYPSSTGVVASLSKTQDGQTVAATGTVTVKGSLAKTQDGQTVASTGTVTVKGTLAKTQDNQTVAATAGGVAVTATLNKTQDGQTVAASGTVTVKGTLSKTQDGQTAAATGTVTVKGTLAKTQDGNTASSSGTVTVKGTLNKTQDDQTVAATAGGAVVERLGTLNKTQDGQTASASVRLDSNIAVTGFQIETEQGILEVGLTISISVDGLEVSLSVGAPLVWGYVNDSQTPVWVEVDNSQTDGWTAVDDAQTPGWSSVGGA